MLPVPYAFVFEAVAPAYSLSHFRKDSPEAIAGFALNQWVRLNWPMPDVVIAISQTVSMAQFFAFWLSVPCMSILSSSFNEWRCDTEKIEEDQILLLFDLNSSSLQLQKMVAALSEAFPKRIYVLSLIQHDLLTHP